MRLIDKHTDRQLIQKLHKLKEQPDAIGSQRYIHFKFSGQLKTFTREQVCQVVVAAAEKCIQDADHEIYVCEDGDIFIFAADMSQESALKMMLGVTSKMRVPVTENYAGLYEMKSNIEKLLITVEHKLERCTERSALNRFHCES